jgi:predicted transcriptional regulator
MMASAFIDPSIVPLKISDSVAVAIDFFKEFSVRQLPVVQDNICIGILSLDEIEEELADIPVLDFINLSYSFASTYDHIYEVMRAISEQSVTLFPIIDENNNLAAAALQNVMGEATTGIKRDTRRIAVSAAITPTFTVALVEAKTENSGRTGTLNGDETVRALQAGYNLGPVALTASHNRFTNLAGRTGVIPNDDGSLSILRLTTKF